jgi:hypothetical protein
MEKKKYISSIVLIWLAWAILLIGFQQVVVARFSLQPPDYALNWTPSETTPSNVSKRPNLHEPFLNTQAAWDSEYYISMALKGYKDPTIEAIPDLEHTGQRISLSYAFMPLYSLMMKGLAYLLKVFGLNDRATVVLAGVIISLLGALAGMFGIFELTRDKWGEEGGLRAAFYLLIFPSCFFLAQVYTEGLFIGLTFGCLALLHRRKWLWAGLLAAISIWARPGGGLILIAPMLLVWLMDRTWIMDPKIAYGRLAAVAAPLFSYIIWTQTSLANHFWQVEDRYFSRGLLLVNRSYFQWRACLSSIFSGQNSQAAVYYAIEFGTIILALVCILLSLKDAPELALYSLGVLVFSITSGSPQGMVRYLLAAPCIFFVLAGWGRSRVFDRAWSVASLLLMGMLVTLFSFNFWVA